MENKKVNLKEIVGKVIEKEDLNEEEVKTIVDSIENNSFEPLQMAGLLCALESKKVTADELYYFIKNLIKKAVTVELGEDCIDVCGTGGDKKGTFNISTASMFVLAGAGAKVAKHGNKAVSSKSGSSDVLSALGINAEGGSGKAKESIEKSGLAFLFAPKHHPAFKYIAPVRKGLGMRTIFNMMGPLLNPGKVKRQLMGVFDPDITKLIAETMKKNGIVRGMVVHGDGLDEITITGKTKITELKNGEIKSYEFDPKEYGFEYGNLEELQVEDSQESAERVMNILKGEESKARDVVVLNAAAGLMVAGLADDFKEGIEKSEKSIDSGKALKKLKIFKGVVGNE